MINLDWTIIATGVVFLLTLWLINILLFRPLFRVMDQRRSMTSGTQEVASEKERYREEMLDQYAEKIKAERQRGYQLAEAIRRETLEKRREQVASARAEADKLLNEARRKVELEIEDVKNSIKRDAEEIAGLITARVLDRT
ncbi:MAG: ATP synthase F0 subunit B [Acidobacteriota bacterium]|nr:MAG: ATP synthase F0 subunit B [Acidobacteriota bacterium]